MNNLLVLAGILLLANAAVGQNPCPSHSLPCPLGSTVTPYIFDTYDYRRQYQQSGYGDLSAMYYKAWIGDLVLTFTELKCSQSTWLNNQKLTISAIQNGQQYVSFTLWKRDNGQSYEQIYQPTSCNFYSGDSVQFPLPNPTSYVFASLDPSVPGPRLSFATVHLEGDPDNFDLESFRQAIAAMVGVAPEDILILAITSGSVVVDFTFAGNSTANATALVDTFLSVAESTNSSALQANGFTVLNVSATPAAAPAPTSFPSEPVAEDTTGNSGSPSGTGTPTSSSDESDADNTSDGNSCSFSGLWKYCAVLMLVLFSLVP